MLSRLETGRDREGDLFASVTPDFPANKYPG
jgi:hypothetical protein